MGYQCKNIDGVRISDGNSKLGILPNISLTPCAACRPDAPCKAQCYARKAFRQYTTVRKAWNGNLRVARSAPDRYFRAIRTYLAKYRPGFFRWHVAGDILGQAYLAEMKAIAREFPGIRFLAFTKRHELSFRQVPENLTIVFSMWPQWGNARKHMPRAWYQDGTETRVPNNALQCPGHCEGCGLCWALPELGRDVVFNKH